MNMILIYYYLVKNEKCLLLDKKTPDKLNEYKVDTKKKIFIHNLFNYSLVDMLTILKLLLQMEKIVLYKHSNNISVKIKDTKKKNIDYKSLIFDYTLFFKEYLLRNKHEKDMLFNMHEYFDLYNRGKLKDKTTKRRQCSNPIFSHNISSSVPNKKVYLSNKNNASFTHDIKKKKTCSIKFILKRIIKKLGICIKDKCYINNVKGKELIFKFYVNNKKFYIFSFYKKIKGIYHLYRNILYVKGNNNINKEIAIINLILLNRRYYDRKKNSHIVNSLYIKYYIKYDVNKLFHIPDELIKNSRKTLEVNNFIYLSQVGKCFDEKTDRSDFCLSKNVVNLDESANKNTIKKSIHRHTHNNNIRIKLIKIYFNGKLFVSMPIVLIYNVIKNVFFMNNIFYFDIMNINLTNLYALKDIYFNNKLFFQNNNFIYLNNQNIILNSDELKVDLNYILLFYFLYFNKKENLRVPEQINPNFYFYFYSLLRNKDKENSKRIKKIVYREDKNILNFVF
ncbi:conserved Plasmodium protein, unknown function [Plasmodium malariae]|uniref:Uncharacterized protein n=1 Tax=Plasmodium malariae TaxID=5858 RepID=A0A1C3KZG1_PLAMA|nr:conserved Plasmodium protein, unknown function [Plasmodium malariae]